MRNALRIIQANYEPFQTNIDFSEGIKEGGIGTRYISSTKRGEKTPTPHTIPKISS
jgi:hypothetical protein